MQGREVTDTVRRWSGIFATRRFYLTPVPTYAGGAMAMGFASKSDVLMPDEHQLNHKAQSLPGLRYYTGAAHLGAFGLPRFVQALLVD